MCNYPEESSRPLSTMECQNAFDQLVSEAEQTKAADNYSPDAEHRTDIAHQYKLFAESLTPKQCADIELEKLCEDHDRWLDEEDAKAKKTSAIDALEKAADESGIDMTDMLNDMREAAGLSTEDEKNIPTLTKETIEKATEAFDDVPTDEAVDVDLDEGEAVDVNETSNTEFFEEDAPDEGEEEPNPVKEAFAKVAAEVDQKLNDECEGNCIKCENHCHDKVDVKVPSENDKFRASCAIEFLHKKEIGQDNVADHLDVIDDIYTTLTETQLKLVTDEAPWLTAVFQDADIRKAERESAARKEAELEAADEKSKAQAEQLTSKLEGKTGNWEADARKAQYDAWTDLVKKWPTLSKDVQDVLDRIPGFTAFRNYIQSEMYSEAFKQKIDYDPEQTVKEMARAHELGNISAADAAKFMDEPDMISKFTMGNSPELDQLNKERNDFSSNNFSKAKDMFEKLQKDGHIPPTNKGADPRLFGNQTYRQFWKNAPEADLGNTLICGPMPCMSDKVKDGNGFGKGDCTVGDIFEQEYARTLKVNASHPIVQPKKPLTPEESLANLMTDLPKTMVNKILAIPSDDWKFKFDGEAFELCYSVASRTIRLSMFKKKLEDSTHLGSVFSLSFVNDGPGSVQYNRSFNALKDISAAGPNAKKLYQWFGKIIATFFSK